MVCLPKTHKPVFPDQCAHCGSLKPGSTVPFEVEGLRFAVPICEGCASRIRLREVIQRWLLRGGTIAAFVVVLVVLFWLHPGRSGGKVLAFLIAGACIVPWLAYTWLAPVPLMLLTFEDKVRFEFRSPNYAADFAALNGTTT